MKSFRFALKQIAPYAFSYIFIGLAFGILMQEAGYSVFWTAMSAIFIYAGSMQLVMVPLLQAGASLPMLALITVFVNARHMFYGIGFIDKFRRCGGIKYPYMVLTLTDEAYSALCSARYPDDVSEDDANFYILFSSHMLWIVSCTLGGLIGKLLTFDMNGIAFSATAFFAAVVVEQWRKFASHIPVLIGFVSAVVFYIILGAENFILPALSVSMLALIVLRDRVELKKAGVDHE